MKKPAIPVERKLQLEVGAAALLVSQLKESGFAEDSQLLADTIEGETSLHELISKVVESIVLEDEVILTGLAKAKEQCEARAQAVSGRLERKKAILLTALQVAELKSLKLPLATLSLRAVPPKMIVTDEAAVPAQWWVRPDPVLDKKALNERARKHTEVVSAAMEIKDQAEREAAIDVAHKDFPLVPGTEISNGSQTIALRK